MSLLKTTLLSLSVLAFSFIGTLFLYQALAFVVPGSAAPAGNVSLPLNVSSDAQTKQGPLGATKFQDTDNTNYFFKPSGLSKLGGTLDLSSNPIKNVQNPVDSQDVATKAYVDEKIGNIGRYDTIVERITRDFSWYTGGSECVDGRGRLGIWWMSCDSRAIYFNSQQRDQVILLANVGLQCPWSWLNCYGSVRAYLDGRHVGDAYASRFSPGMFSYITT